MRKNFLKLLYMEMNKQRVTVGVTAFHIQKQNTFLIKLNIIYTRIQATDCVCL